MKAVVHDRYGPPGVLRLEDLERPVPIYGASAAIGTAGVRLAKRFGADVTAVTDTRHTHWRTWSRRRGTTRPARRPATSS